MIVKGIYDVSVHVHFRNSCIRWQLGEILKPLRRTGQVLYMQDRKLEFSTLPMLKRMAQGDEASALCWTQYPFYS